MYKVIGIIGESGSGKDTLLKKLISEAGPAPTSIFHSLISCTTRPKRNYEKEGVDYYFLDNEEFAQKVLNNEFLEVSEFNKWFYGTLKSELKEDKINIAVLNPEGVESLLLHKDIQLVVIYLEVSGKTRLIRQLQREENPDIPEIYRRYLADDEDFYNLPFPYEAYKNENKNDFEIAWRSILQFANNWAMSDNEN